MAAALALTLVVNVASAPVARVVSVAAEERGIDQRSGAGLRRVELGHELVQRELLAGLARAPALQREEVQERLGQVAALVADLGEEEPGPVAHRWRCALVDQLGEDLPGFLGQAV